MKWQKETFPGIEIDTSQPPVVFKTQLYTLTGVPPERQKIMVKGGILKVIHAHVLMDTTDFHVLLYLIFLCNNVVNFLYL